MLTTAPKMRSAAEAGRLASFFPFEGFRISLAALPVVTAGALPLVELAALQSVVCVRVSRSLGSSIPRAPSFPTARGVSRPPSPITCVMGSSSRALRSPSESFEPRPASLATGTFPGVSFPIAASVGGVHLPTCVESHEPPKLAPFRPRRFSRPRRFPPPPTFAGLFHPAATSGIRSSRVRSSREVVRARRPPLPSCRLRLPPAPVFTMAPETCARLQGFFPLASPLSSREHLAHNPRAPFLSFSFFRFSFACREERFRAPSVLGLVPPPRPLARPLRLHLTLDVLSTRDLMCSCEPNSPVQGFRPSASAARPFFLPGSPLRPPNDFFYKHGPYQLGSARNPLEARAPKWL